MPAFFTLLSEYSLSKWFSGEFHPMLKKTLHFLYLYVSIHLLYAKSEDWAALYWFAISARAGW